jgi:UDP-N-acetylmuramoyl-tripeptide--D-alanyl-D-alanine ligase
MSDALWTWDELVAAADAGADGHSAAPITGFAIDTRALVPGEVFVALADARDGHDFVPEAFARGAAAAIVARSYDRLPGDGALLRVADPLGALEAIARAARARSAAQIVAVTGSVGKTGTKDALRRCLERVGPTHAAEKSFNNHWGVPLTLARLPAAARFGVFEIGMNHAGEITPLTRMVRPHAAIVTTVEPVHLEYFANVAAIAEAKAEIFLGLEEGGAAIINCDNPYFELLARRAEEAGARVVSFGRHPEATVRAEKIATGTDGSEVEARCGARQIVYRVGAPGAHVAQNSLAILAALDVLGVDLETALPALAELSAGPGRGARSVLAVAGGTVLLIDESYNANPASMRAALAAMATVPRSRYRRRIAVLGDMLELGREAPTLHRGLAEAIDAAGVDLVFACGPNMARLLEVLPEHRRGAWAETSDGLMAPMLEAVAAGDVVMVKGSLGSRMAVVVEALRVRSAEAACA